MYRVIDLDTAQCGRLKYIIIRNEVYFIDVILIVWFRSVIRMCRVGLQMQGKVYKISITYRIRRI